MKVLIGTDLEGVSGVASFETQTSPDTRYYERARKLQTAEINAAIEGLVEEAATDILVVDGHGPGAVLFEELHPAARLLHGRPAPPRSLRWEIAKRYEVCMQIGQHAMCGTQTGTLNHTQSSRTIECYKLNGKPIGEIAQFALSHGALGLPMIFLSGDEAACREAEALVPSVTTAAVKEGLSRQAAISLSQEQAHNLIREKVREAVRRHKENPLPPLVWKGPFTLEKRFLFTDNANPYDTDPRYERVDARTVRITSDNILDVIYA